MSNTFDDFAVWLRVSYVPTNKSLRVETKDFKNVTYSWDRGKNLAVLDGTDISLFSFDSIIHVSIQMTREIGLIG